MSDQHRTTIEPGDRQTDFEFALHDVDDRLSAADGERARTPCSSACVGLAAGARSAHALPTKTTSRSSNRSPASHPQTLRLPQPPLTHIYNTTHHSPDGTGGDKLSLCHCHATLPLSLMVMRQLSKSVSTTLLPTEHMVHMYTLGLTRMRKRQMHLFTCDLYHPRPTHCHSSLSPCAGLRASLPR